MTARAPLLPVLAEVGVMPKYYDVEKLDLSDALRPSRDKCS